MRLATRWLTISLLTLGIGKGLAETHWAFEPVLRDPPTKGEATVIIDRFIDAKLSLADLERAPIADRYTLIRRLYLVVLGVLPTLQEVTAFAQDPSSTADAWQRLVDKVLGDPRYGERWAQHWLDTIRWAETVGFETNSPRPNAWHYRDWVIDALNADKPYDEFIREQLVGDACGADAALGFLVAGPANLPGQIGRDEQAMRGARQDELDEVIRTVSQSFLALTVECARCHDHKFDPISARDYYSLQAIFSGLEYGERRLRGPQNDTWSAQVPAKASEVKRLESELEALRVRNGLKPPLGEVETVTFEARTVAAVRMRIEATSDGSAASLYELEVWQSGSRKNVALASEGGNASASSFALENQTRHPDCLNDGSVDRRQSFAWRSGKGGAAWVEINLKAAVLVDRVVWHRGYSAPADFVIETRAPGSADWEEVAHARDRLPAPSDTRVSERVFLEGLTQAQIQELVLVNQSLTRARGELARLKAGPQVYAARFKAQPDSAWLLNRGDAMQRTERVQPGVPAVPGDYQVKNSADEISPRLALVEHLLQRDHPLTARVLANRVWQYLFGIGLVDTPSDFGKMGSKPTHPKLLDWLAADFMDHGWSIKHLHRRILLSGTFRQSNTPRDTALAIDAETRLLWRFPPRRMEAEVIRDSILATSGKLNRQAGGVGFDFFVQQGGLSDYQSHDTFTEVGWRRMVYARKIRMQAVDVFGTFDCPDAGQMKPRRTQSITPIQSFGLMNSPFALRQARFFAARVEAEVGNDPSKQVRRAIELAFSRPADAQECEPLVSLAEEHGLLQVCRVLFNASEFIRVP